MASQQKPAIAYWLENKLYLNLTNQCSNNCYFCLKNFKSGVNDFNLRLLEEPTPAQVITELEEILPMRSWAELVFCGFGEPTEKLDCLLEVAHWTKHQDDTIPIRLNTNGHAYLLNPNRNVVKDLKTAGIRKVSVSLNAQDEKKYDEICRPQFANAYKSIIDFIEKAKEELEVEITAVTIPEVDLQQIAEIARKMKLPFRLRPYIPCFW